MPARSSSFRNAFSARRSGRLATWQIIVMTCAILALASGLGYAIMAWLE